MNALKSRLKKEKIMGRINRKPKTEKPRPLAPKSHSIKKIEPEIVHRRGFGHTTKQVKK
jgi:hypothetical protein